MSLLPPGNGNRDNPLRHMSRRAYRKAFENYLRYGTPISLLEAKADAGDEDHPTTHYIWRTQGDGKVRQSHAANDGKIFSWDNPPKTGHPGEDYGCRCIAVAYYPEVDEFFKIDLRNVSDSGRPWSRIDFVNHYFHGNGRTVTVRETGHLADIIAQYHSIVIDNPNRLPGQIADEARKNVNQSFSDTFENVYQMRGVVFSIGKTTIKGEFSGYCKEMSGILEITGTIDFELVDAFRDPLDIGEILPESVAKIDDIIIDIVVNTINTIGDAISDTADLIDDVVARITDKIGEVDQTLRDYIYDRALRELLRRRKKAAYDLAAKDLRELPGGTPYDIVDEWSASFSAKVYLDGQRSKFKK